MSSERTLREVRRRRDRLREEYGDLEKTVVEIGIDPAETTEDYLGGAYCWVTRTADEAPALTESMPDAAADDGERVLLILGRGSDHWGVPGGGIEGHEPGDPGSGETAEAAAVREVHEEVGIEVAVDDCLLIETIEWTAPGGDVVAESLHPLFAATYEGGTIDVQGGELNGAAWFRRAPREVHPMIAGLAGEFFDEAVAVGDTPGERTGGGGDREGGKIDG